VIRCLSFPGYLARLRRSLRPCIVPGLYNRSLGKRIGNISIRVKRRIGENINRQQTPVFASSVWRSRLTRTLETCRVTGCASQTNYLRYHTPSLWPFSASILFLISFIRAFFYISFTFLSPYPASSSNCICPCGEALDLLRRSQAGPPDHMLGVHCLIVNHSASQIQERP
jgi:hypothetical protein